MKNIVRLLLVACLVATTRGGAEVLRNGNFEKPGLEGYKALDGWKTLGQVTAEQLGQKVDGDWGYALLDAEQGGSPLAALRSFLGEPSKEWKDLNQTTKASVLQQTVDVKPGERLTFDWDVEYMAEGPAETKAVPFVAITPSKSNAFIRLKFPKEKYPYTTGKGRESIGWQRFSQPIDCSGRCTISIGIAIPEMSQSALRVKRVKIAK
jgi:hypothetical protein